MVSQAGGTPTGAASTGFTLAIFRGVVCATARVGADTRRHVSTAWLWRTDFPKSGERKPRIVFCDRTANVGTTPACARSKVSATSLSLRQERLGMTEAADVMQGTLDLLILKALSLEAMHGWGISSRL